MLEQLPGELCHRYGEEHLLARAEDGGARVPVALKGFVEGAYPSQVFDVGELFYAEIPAERRLDFQLEMNSVLEEERSDWRMADGQFFKVDSQFLEAHVIARSYQRLKAEGFEGALDELNQARNELAADNVKGAIHNACKSLESVIKAVSGTESGNASALVRGLADKGFYEGIPEDVGRAFGEQVSWPYRSFEPSRRPWPRGKRCGGPSSLWGTGRAPRCNLHPFRRPSVGATAPSRQEGRGARAAGGDCGGRRHPFLTAADPLCVRLQNVQPSSRALSLGAQRQHPPAHGVC